MALLRPQLEMFLLTKLHCSRSSSSAGKSTATSTISGGAGLARAQCSSAMAIDAPPSSVAGIRWGSTSLQGLREEMEDEVVVRADALDGFSFAAVLDGHGGLSSVKFLRDELYKECAAALQVGLLLSGKDSNAIRDSLKEAFENVDARLLDRLEMVRDGDESGSTATVLLMGNDVLIVAHIGDSSVVLSRSGKAKVLTDPHRPYGSNKSSLQEIKRIREAGGWINNGRICGDIAVSRAFGDIQFKTKKNEMLQKGVLEGRWSEKFISRVRFSGDLVVASPDVYQIPLESDSEFVLLASDGLWDYINSSEAVNFVRNRLRKHGDVQLACEELAYTALDRLSQDNISIIIADLGRTDWQALPVQQQNFFYELGQAFATVGVVLLGIWMSSQFPL